MKKNIIILLVAIVGIAAILFYFKPLANDPLIQENGQNSTDSHFLYNHQADQSDKRINNDIDRISMSKKNDQGEQLFVAIEPNAARTLILPEHFKGHEDGFLFSFDIDKMSSRQVGDQFGLKMLQFDINRKALIQSIDQLDDNIVKWQGTFEGYPADLNYFTITQSQQDRYAVMKIFTDKGSFVAEIKDGIGLAQPETALVDDGLNAH